MGMIEDYKQVASSFRDPSGFVFTRDGSLYRQINRNYQKNYQHLIKSGLYDRLTGDRLLISHTEQGPGQGVTEEVYQVIKPEPISFVSYPYEWCFSQLKHAALLTLDIQMKALEYGMSLKDCSAYNVQFEAGKSIFIDTLSFEVYREGQPWVAYRQFCQHFLAPLAVMSYTDIRLQQLLRTYIDGIPLDLASSLLPARSWLSFGLLSHLHLHAKSQKRFAGQAVATDGHRVGRTAMLGLIDNLRAVIEKLKWQPAGTDWHDYYAFSNYSDAALEYKKQVVSGMVDEVASGANMIWDLGANVGVFSRIAAKAGLLTISADMDPAAVEKNYLESVRHAEKKILPLVLDLTNPSAGRGWANEERMSFVERGPADVGLALALVHHLAIGNNLPFQMLVQFFSQICRALIIEFVPKSDSQVQKLLANREDIFDDYEETRFEAAFSEVFEIRSKKRIPETERTLYLMKRR